MALPQLKEGEIYVLSAKAARVQENLMLEVEKAEAEKKQVKMLVSNMSHQLKTPLDSENREQKIFFRFYRGVNAAAQEGFGIGLYLSRLIVEKEGGYITVESMPGAGSCFRIFLQNVV